MRYRLFVLFALVLGSASGVFAQEPAAVATAQTNVVEESKPDLQQRLLPEGTATLLAPASAEATKSADGQPALLAQRRGSGTGLIIAGGALFVAGLLVGGDAGTVLAVTGAAIGAYGLYLYFQ
jgi:hypothetical protein